MPTPDLDPLGPLLPLRPGGVPAHPPQTPEGVGSSYDRVAEQYSARFSEELRHKPLDRALLNCFAELVRGLGPVADLGCGPGHVTRYLHDRGIPALGIDLSGEMVVQAQRLNPGLTFRQGTILDLDVDEAAWGGIVAFYSIIHLEPDELSRAFAEFRRALRPGGRLLLAFHAGTETRHLDEWWGEPVSLDFHFFLPEAIEDRLTAAGFTVEARVEREPYTDVEVETRRAYLLALRP